MSGIEQIADKDQALALGRENSDLAWISSDRDIWHRNPFYDGPRQPHPEDDYAHDYIAEHGIEAWRAMTEKATQTSSPTIHGFTSTTDGEMPF